MHTRPLGLVEPLPRSAETNKREEIHYVVVRFAKQVGFYEMYEIRVM